MNRKKFLVFGSPKIEKAEIQEVVNILKSGWLGLIGRYYENGDTKKHLIL